MSFLIVSTCFPAEFELTISYTRVNLREVEYFLCRALNACVEAFEAFRVNSGWRPFRATNCINCLSNCCSLDKLHPSRTMFLMAALWFLRINSAFLLNRMVRCSKTARTLRMDTFSHNVCFRHLCRSCTSGHCPRQEKYMALVEASFTSGYCGVPWQRVWGLAVCGGGCGATNVARTSRLGSLRTTAEQNTASTARQTP